MTKENQLIVPDEVILNKIYLIRGQKVMLDRDLAEMYGVETKGLFHKSLIDKETLCKTVVS
jgi:hypothetical protein